MILDTNQEARGCWELEGARMGLWEGDVDHTPDLWSFKKTNACCPKPPQAALCDCSLGRLILSDCSWTRKTLIIENV